MLYKKCRCCGEVKEIKDFHNKKSSPDGHVKDCKECVKDIQKKYKEAPDFKEKRKEYDKQRYSENRESILERKKEYHIENRDKILENKREYNSKVEVKEKMKEYNKYYRTECKDKFYSYRRNNPHIIAWRSLLYSTLNRLGTPKQAHTIHMLGYSALDLKCHIEQLFTSGMSWNNHGEWHIDHIRPVINFSDTDDVRDVCALSNLRPLWATSREIDGIEYEGNLNRHKF
jgi:hypothetical protein